MTFLPATIYEHPIEDQYSGTAFTCLFCSTL